MLQLLPNKSLYLNIFSGIKFKGVRLATGWMIMVRFQEGAGNFSLHHRVQNGSVAHPASYPLGTRGSFPVDK
jgi:hypothetical protein